MSVVKINVLTVPESMRDTLEERFTNRAGEVEKTPGFESFELMRPTDGSDRYFVVTRWESEDAFEAWVSSREFQHGHAQSNQGQRPAAADSELLSFEIVLSATRPGA
jgi:heme-degrading monooxygenase HmoA